MGDELGGSNPCRLVARQLANMVMVIKHVDKKIRDLELDVDVMAKYSGREEEASEAAVQMLEETKTLVEAVKISNRDLKIANKNFEDLLVSTVDQLKLLSVECTEMENYMAQYGYQMPPPVDPARFDIFSRAAPPAAGDLVPPPPAAAGGGAAPPPASPGAAAEQKHQQGVAASAEVAEIAAGGGKIVEPANQFEVPSIFDIGLSAETLQRLAGVDSMKESNPVLASAKKFLDSVSKSSTTAGKKKPEAAGAEPWEKMQRLNVSSFLESETTYQASPVLKLSNHIAAVQLSPASPGPYVFKQMSEKELNEPVEISPDLYTRRQSNKANRNKTPATPVRAELKSDDMPETPELETVNLRALISKHGSLGVEPSASLRDKVNAAEKNIPTPEFLSLNHEEKLSGSVETPELLTMDLGQHLAQRVQMSTRSPDTPELESTY